MYTHKNLLSIAHAGYIEGFYIEGAPDTYISYLPLSHSLEMLIHMYGVMVGLRIGYYSGNILKLTEDM